MFKQRSRKSEVLRHGGIWALSCILLKSQMCSIGLRYSELGGQDIYCNFSSHSWNHSNTIRARWHGAISSLKTPFPFGEAIRPQWYSDSPRPSRVFYFNHRSKRYTLERSLKHNIATTGLCTTCRMSRKNSSLRRRHTVTRTSTFWKPNSNSSDHATSFNDP